MNGKQTGDHNVDIVICIDGTASMAPIMDKVKENVSDFCYNFIDALESREKSVEKVRAKVIVFRNYGFDDEPMTVSDFYTLPEQREEFNSFVNGIEAKGGDGGPTNALEAIALALKSDWTTNGNKRRHVIMVYTDKAAIPLGDSAGLTGYPEGMPADLSALYGWWEGLTAVGTYSAKAGRMFAFAPKVYPWTDLEVWNRYWPAFSVAGTDLSDLDKEFIFGFPYSEY